MRERVELLNGTLEIDSGTGGTVVTVLAPIKEAVR
jgi:signal transduction histidine kinase